MSERFTQIFGPEWTEATRPATLSTKLGETARDLERRHVDLRNFLVRELGAGQGRFKPKNFIDPLPVIKTLRETESLASVAPLPENYQEGTAKTRFADVSRLGAYVDLDQRLEAERSELAARLDEIRQMLGEHGCQSADLHDALTAWLPTFVDVINLQRGYRHRPPALELRTQAFEDWWQKGVFRQRGEIWANNLRKAAATVGGESTKVLGVRPGGRQGGLGGVARRPRAPPTRGKTTHRTGNRPRRQRRRRLRRPAGRVGGVSHPAKSLLLRGHFRP